MCRSVGAWGAWGGGGEGLAGWLPVCSWEARWVLPTHPAGKLHQLHDFALEPLRSRRQVMLGLF